MTTINGAHHPCQAVSLRTLLNTYPEYTRDRFGSPISSSTISPFLNNSRSATFQSLILASADSIPGCFVSSGSSHLKFGDVANLTTFNCLGEDVDQGRKLLRIWMICRSVLYECLE